MSREVMVIGIGVLMALSGLIAYYDDEIFIAIGRIRIKMLDLWIKILSGKNNNKK